jgi:hypothetical protein
MEAKYEGWALGIVVAKGIQAVKSVLCGVWDEHPTDTQLIDVCLSEYP